MEKGTLERLMPTAFLAVVCTVVQLGGTEVSSQWWFALYFHFLHAGVCHFLANFIVMARFQPRLTSVPPAYLSASAASFIGLAWHSAPTVGISAIIFAMLARRDAILGYWNWKLLALNLALGIIPAYDWRIHAISYLISFFGWKIRIRFLARGEGRRP